MVPDSWETEDGAAREGRPYRVFIDCRRRLNFAARTNPPVEMTVIQKVELCENRVIS